MQLSKTKETSISKYLSLVLRHKPEVIGLSLDKKGWADVQELLSKSNRKFSLEELYYVVQNNSKQRFTFNEDQSKIRANQGHSLEIDLQLKPQTPPDILYHGTATKNIDSIKSKGLTKQNRQYVHLSKDYETAFKAGSRYGETIVLAIKTHDMFEKGHKFFVSKNGVWLTDNVPPSFILQEN